MLLASPQKNQKSNLKLQDCLRLCQNSDSHVIWQPSSSKYQMIRIQWADKLKSMYRPWNIRLLKSWPNWCSLAPIVYAVPVGENFHANSFSLNVFFFFLICTNSVILMNNLHYLVNMSQHDKSPPFKNSRCTPYVREKAIIKQRCCLSCILPMLA